MRSALLLVTALTLLAGCPLGSGGGDDDPPLDAAVGTIDAPLDGPGTVAPAFQRCVGRPFTAPAAGSFDHTTNAILAATNAPIHAGLDTIETPGAPHVGARFMYGTINKDLEDEPVAVSIDDCTGWQSLGTHQTDGDGAIDVAVALPLGPGVYEVRYAVVGDASTTVSYLWMLPVGTHVVLTDIDGTLTTSDTELFLQILNGSYVPAAYPSATDLTTAHAGKGHIVVYATGRPNYLTGKTREWLTQLGFALGPVRLAPGVAEALPTDTGVGTYKRDFFTSLTGKGLVIDLAYGNATTDIFAYSGAGVPADRQWIIGTNAGMSGTNAVMDSWAARVGEVQALPAVTQPFTF
jgi:hypothetical protein